jgi:hypothetical protein
MKIPIKEVCFVKWGCSFCRRLAEEQFKNTGYYNLCEDVLLSLEEKKAKLLKRYNAEGFIED